MLFVLFYKHRNLYLQFNSFEKLTVTVGKKTATWCDSRRGFLISSKFFLNQSQQNLPTSSIPASLANLAAALGDVCFFAAFGAGIAETF